MWTEPTALGTAALAGVTLLLACATVWLGASTRSMANETRKMAKATQQLVAIEEARRAEENRAELVIERRVTPTYSRSVIGGGSAGGRSVSVRNTLRGEATGIEVIYRDGDRAGRFIRDRLGGSSEFSFFENEFEDEETNLPHDADRHMQLRWTDVRGRRASPIYVWREGNDGAPMSFLFSTLA